MTRTLQLQRKNNQTRNPKSMIQFEQSTVTAPKRKSAPPPPPIDCIRIGTNSHCPQQQQQQNSQNPSSPHHRTGNGNGNGANQRNSFTVSAHAPSFITSSRYHPNSQQTNHHSHHHVNGVRLRRLSHSWSLLRVLNRSQNTTEYSRNRHKSSTNDIDPMVTSKCHAAAQPSTGASTTTPIAGGATITPTVVPNLMNSCQFKSDSPSSSHSEFWHNRVRAHSLAGLYPHHHRALFVDKVSRWIFPLSFIVLNLLYWTYYLELLHSILPSSIADNLPSLF